MTNGLNGMLGASQMVAMQAQRVNPFDKMDVNGDGSLDTDEIGAISKKFSKHLGQPMDASDIVTKLDSDGDSLISQDEFKTGKPKGPPPGMVEMSGGMQKGEYQSLVNSMKNSDEEEPEISDSLDTNGDGIVDAEEAMAGMNMIFQKYVSQLSTMSEQSSATESQLDILA